MLKYLIENYQIILFDLDETLFNTQQFTRKATVQLQTILNISSSELQQHLSNFFALNRHEIFRPQLVSEYLQQHVPNTHIPIDFWDQTELYQDCLYPDSLVVLQELSQHFQLGIFSQGDIPFQTNKAVNSVIHNYINPTLLFISENKTSDEFIQTLPEESMVIDNDQRVVQSLRQYDQPVLWLNREHNKEITGIQEIHTLSDLLS